MSTLFLKTRSRNKFKNEPTIVDDIRFHSKGEANRYLQLKDEEKLGLIRNLKLQVPFPMIHNGELICTYRADFVYARDGQRVVEDHKGFRTNEYKMKKKMMKAFYNIIIKET